MSTEVSLFYTTCPDENTAQKISSTLLEEKLIACSNLYPVVKSQYWWEGKIESSTECVLILKALNASKEALKARFLELHPYEIPCFLEMPITSGIHLYLEWLKSAQS
jgi:periplasmic divalent cation tolerance protein